MTKKGRTVSKYRVLMFAPAFAPFANPEAIVNSKLVLAMIGAGWNVDVITRSDNDLSNYNYGSEWEDCWLSLRAFTYPVTYTGTGRHERIIDNARGCLKTGYAGVGCRWAAHAIDLALQMHREKKYDIIISRALPDFAHVPALSFNKLTNVPWIANWNDPPVFLFPPPYDSRMNIFRKFINDRLVRSVIARAAYLTFPSERIKTHLCEHYGETYAAKGFVIPHVALSRPAGITPSRNYFTLCHAGNLYPERDPSIFFQGLSLFLQKHHAAPVRFVNIGIEAVDIKKIIEKEGLSDHFISLGKKSYQETIEYLYRSDVLVVIEGRYAESIFLPSKISDYVQTGRPILSISPLHSAVNDIIKEHGGGIVANCCSPNAIKDALCSLYEHWKSGSLDNKYGSRHLYQLFSPETIIAHYETIFDKIGVKNIGV